MSIIQAISHAILFRWKSFQNPRPSSTGNKQWCPILSKTKPTERMPGQHLVHTFFYFLIKTKMSWLTIFSIWMNFTQLHAKPWTWRLARSKAIACHDFIMALASTGHVNSKYICLRNVVSDIVSHGVSVLESKTHMTLLHAISLTFPIAINGIFQLCLQHHNQRWPSNKDSKTQTGWNGEKKKRAMAKWQPDDIITHHHHHSPSLQLNR